MNIIEPIVKCFKPERKKITLSAILLLIAGSFFILIYMLGVTVPKGLLILKLLFLPFVLTTHFGLTYQMVVLCYFLTILWLYIVSCIVIFISIVKWNVKKISAIATVAIIAITLYGFFNLGFGDAFIKTADDSKAKLNEVAEIVKGNNKFAIALYQHIGKESEDNIFFSPWSISTAMAMIYEGGRGQTAKEIQSVFYFPEDGDARRFSFARLLNAINKTGGRYELHAANSIWLQINYPFLKEYKKTINRYYLGEINNLDFINNPTGSSNRMNLWIARHTNNKIKRIVEPNLLNKFTRAVLANAIYFKGKWEYQFKKNDTKPEDFALHSGEKIKVPLMTLEDDEILFYYTEAEGVQVLELRYRGEKISMLVLLPRNDITQLESILTEEKLQEWSHKLQRETVYIYMPKFTAETSYSLMEYLKRLGIRLPFTWPGADFSGMDGTKMLYISDILHKAYIDVNEEGTEAAAATANIFMMGSEISSHVEFRADHPFVYIIQERKTGNILFIGRVMNPVK